MWQSRIARRLVSRGILACAIAAGGCYHFAPVSSENAQNAARQAGIRKERIRVTFAGGNWVDYRKSFIRGDSLFDTHVPFFCKKNCDADSPPQTKMELRNGHAISDVIGASLRRIDGTRTAGAIIATPFLLVGFAWFALSHGGLGGGI